MDSNSRIRVSTSNSSSRRCQSRSDAFHLVEEIDGDDEPRPEYLCPFCAEDFDIVGLYCHIDEEHPVEAKNGECPICAKRAGPALVTHVTAQHANLLKVQRKRRFRRGGPTSTLSILKKELRDGGLQSLLGGSSFVVPTEPDPWLSSFMCNAQSKDQPSPSTAASRSAVERPDTDFSQRTEKQHAATLSDHDQEEKARRTEFVQTLLLSTFLDD